MKENVLKENAKFVLRVTLIHFFTYLICGIVFMQFFDYKEMYMEAYLRFYMREIDSRTMLGPLVQLIRGPLFGLTLLLFRDSFMSKKYGWLKLWAIVAGLGIINTPGPAISSIEGIFYTQFPLALHLKGSVEILTQTLLFSWLVTNEKRVHLSNILSKTQKQLVTVLLISAGGFMLSGILLSTAIGADMIAGATDVFAYVVMAISMIIVLITTKWYLSKKGLGYATLYYVICYVSLAVLPTVYNYIVDSVLKSPLALLLNALPLIGVALYLETVKKKNQT